MTIANTLSDLSLFRSGPEFAAWLALIATSHLSGSKEKLGRISERGDRYIRHLLYISAGNAVRFTKARAAWLQRCRPPKVVLVAVVNKMARIAWAGIR
jgi:transposase